MGSRGSLLVAAGVLFAALSLAACAPAPKASPVVPAKAPLAQDQGRPGRVGWTARSGPVGVKLDWAGHYTTETGPGPDHYTLHFLLGTGIVFSNSSDAPITVLVDPRPFALTSLDGQPRPLWNIQYPGVTPSNGSTPTTQIRTLVIAPHSSERLGLEFAAKTSDKGWRLRYQEAASEPATWTMTFDETWIDLGPAPLRK